MLLVRMVLLLVLFVVVVMLMMVRGEGSEAWNGAEERVRRLVVITMVGGPGRRGSVLLMIGSRPTGADVTACWDGRGTICVAGSGRGP